MWKKVLDVMSRHPIVVSPDVAVREAVEKLRGNRIDSLPVVTAEGKLLGLFTKSSLYRLVLSGAGSEEPVSNWMSKDIITIKGDATIEEAWLQPVGRLPVVDDQGRVQGILTRTDLVGAFYEQAKEIADKFKLMFDSTYNGIVAINASGRINFINRSAAEYIGRSREELLLQPIKKIIPNTGLLDTLKTGKATFGQKLVMNDSVYMTNRTPIYEDGEAIGAVGVFQDISEIETISEELNSLKQLNLELNTIIENCHDAIVVADGEGYLQRVNPAYERISMLKAKEIIGKRMQDLEKMDVVSESISLKVLKEGKQTTIIQRLKTGKQILFTGIPIYGKEGRISKVISTGRDMTELNSLKAEKEEAITLSSKYRKELEELRSQQLNFKDIVFASEKMRNTFQLALKIARVDSTVLLLGESGVGKEVIAKLIHHTSLRQKHSFIRINCAAIPENLLEAELFGFEEGAFTGAKKGGKVGLFEAADNGTIFLDEIGEMSLALQAKLLRVLQEQEIVKVGSTKPIKVDVRLIAATNQNLEYLVAQQRFREDLYYRLNVVPMVIAPLRERREDIVPLAINFTTKYNEKYQLNKRLSPPVIDKLLEFQWPGNVRQLENVIERMIVISNSSEITEEDLPSDLFPKETPLKLINISKLIPLKQAIKELERMMIKQALQQEKSVRGAARVLQVNASTIVRKRDKLGIK